MTFRSWFSEKAIKEFEKQFKEIDQFKWDQMEDEAKLRDEHDRLQRQLVQGWREDMAMQEKFTREDQEMIQKLDDLHRRTNSREDQVGLVKDNLVYGIRLMNDYLGKMTSNKKKTDKKTTTSKNTPAMEPIAENTEAAITTVTSEQMLEAQEANEQTPGSVEQEPETIEKLNIDDKDDDEQENLDDHLIQDDNNINNELKPDLWFSSIFYT